MEKKKDKPRFRTDVSVIEIRAKTIPELTEKLEKEKAKGYALVVLGAIMVNAKSNIHGEEQET